MNKPTLDKIISLYNENLSIRRIAYAVKFSRSYIHLILKANIPNYDGNRKRIFFGNKKRKLTPEEKAESMKSRLRTIKEQRWLPVKGLTYFGTAYDTTQYEDIKHIGSYGHRETKDI